MRKRNEEGRRSSSSVFFHRLFLVIFISFYSLIFHTFLFSFYFILLCFYFGFGIFALPFSFCHGDCYGHTPNWQMSSTSMHHAIIILDLDYCNYWSNTLALHYILVLLVVVSIYNCHFWGLPYLQPLTWVQWRPLPTIQNCIQTKGDQTLYICTTCTLI